MRHGSHSPSRPRRRNVRISTTVSPIVWRAFRKALASPGRRSLTIEALMVAYVLSTPTTRKYITFVGGDVGWVTSRERKLRVRQVAERIMRSRYGTSERKER